MSKFIIGINFDGVVAINCFSKSCSSSLSEKNFKKNFTPTQGLLEYLPKIINRHEVIIILDHNRQDIAPAKNWLKNKSIYVPMHDTVKISKNNLIKNLKLDIYVDSKLSELLLLVGQVPKLIFFSKNKTTACNIENIENWSELYKII